MDGRGENSIAQRPKKDREECEGAWETVSQPASHQRCVVLLRVHGAGRSLPEA